MNLNSFGLVSSSTGVLVRIAYLNSSWWMSADDVDDSDDFSFSDPNNGDEGVLSVEFTDSSVEMFGINWGCEFPDDGLLLVTDKLSAGLFDGRNTSHPES